MNRFLELVSPILIWSRTCHCCSWIWNIFRIQSWLYRIAYFLVNYTIFSIFFFYLQLLILFYHFSFIFQRSDRYLDWLVVRLLKLFTELLIFSFFLIDSRLLSQRRKIFHFHIFRVSNLIGVSQNSTLSLISFGET